MSAPTHLLAPPYAHCVASRSGSRAARPGALRVVARLCLLVLAIPTLLWSCDEASRPRLREVSLVSDTADGSGPFVVRAVVDAPKSGDTLVLHYSLAPVDAGTSAEWAAVPMSNGPEGRYTGAIDPLDPAGLFFNERPWPLGTTVHYYVELLSSEGDEELPAGAPDAGAFAFVIRAEAKGIALTAVVPANGHATGREMVFLHGGGFVDGMTVSFGGTAASGIEVVSPSFARALTPAHGAGVVDVTIATAAGRSAQLDDGFRYVGAGGCAHDGECPIGQICEAGRCVSGPSCTRDDECPTGQVCEFGQCQPIACTRDTECADGFVCAGGRCLPQRPCASDAECAPLGMVCLGGACVFGDDCATDGDCPVGMACLFGRCFELPKECLRDQDCPPELVCEFGFCVPPAQCRGDGECPPGWLCAFGACIPGGCAAGEPCPPGTFCDPNLNRCIFDEPCGGPCPPNLICDPARRSCVECMTAAHCPPGLACTGGRCIGGCSATQPCPAGFRCDFGACIPNDPCAGIVCPDGWFCDSLAGGCVPLDLCAGVFCPPGTACDGRTGACAPIPQCNGDFDCRDGRICNGDERCANGVCQGGGPITCQTPDPCIFGSCVEAAGGCVFSTAPDGAQCPWGMCFGGVCEAVECVSNADCDNGNRCDGAERCVGNICVPGGTSIGCDDNSPCTRDVCLPASGQCSFEPLPDGASCGNGRVCMAGACVGGGCTGNGQCSDGLVCNGLEACIGGACVPSPPPPCDDFNVCTIDQCREPFGCSSSAAADGTPCGPNAICLGASCLLVGCTSDTQCSDGVRCNGAERCVAGTCEAGPPLNCGDANPCTNDRCTEAQGCASTPVPDGTSCGSGSFCLGGMCLGATCTNNGDCSDGRACNGSELCLGGMCLPGMGVSCSDNNPCTSDVCSEPFGSCVNPLLPDGTPCDASGRVCQNGLCGTQTCGSDADCSDGLQCNGRELCVVGQCFPGPPVPCDDGNICTKDFCDDATGGCSSVPGPDGLLCGPGGQICLAGRCVGGGGCTSSFDCDDGLGCNGSESCTSVGTCTSGIPVDCTGLVGPCRAPLCLEDGTPDGTCDGNPLPNGTPCVNGGSCQSGQCTHPPGGCRDNSDCPLPLTCNPFTSQCELPITCTSQFDCPAGEICVGGNCEQVSPCNTTADCPTGTVCLGNVCYLAPDCYSDLDCPPGEQCEVFACQPTVCQSDSDCEIGWSCRADRCIPPAYCQSDADCPLFGLQCVNFTCQNPGGCTSDAQCPLNQACLWGACFFLPPAECAYDQDCGAGESCYLGYCQMLMP